MGAAAHLYRLRMADVPERAVEPSELSLTTLPMPSVFCCPLVFFEISMSRLWNFTSNLQDSKEFTTGNVGR